MKTFVALAGAAALLGGCATAVPEDVADTAAMAAPGSPMHAPTYMQMAASGDMFEIESSRLALQMSRNPAVQQFAQMMVSDHTRLSSEMMAAAQTAGLPPPPMQMMPHHAEMLQRLRTAPADQFDMMYKREQIAAHQESLNLHRSYAAGGDNPAFRAVAARAVPAVEMHFQHAQSLPEQAMVAPTYQQSPAPMPAPAPTTRRSGERG
jgi:putative membrane protein